MLQLKNNLPEASKCNLQAVFIFSKLLQLTKKYGSMFTVCLGSVRAVKLYGPYVVK